MTSHLLKAIATQLLIATDVLTLETTLGQIFSRTQHGAAAVNSWNKSVGVGTITLAEMMSHTSGLPKLPSNLHGPAIFPL
jgi:CubicO group peptidase (beta-lactamase class C family)